MWLIHVCDMTPSYVGHVSFECATHSNMPHRHERVTLHSNVRRDCAFVGIRMCDVTRSYVRRDAIQDLIYMYIYVYIYIYSDSLWDMTHSFARLVRRSPNDIRPLQEVLLDVCVTWYNCMYLWHDSIVRMCDIAPSYTAPPESIMYIYVCTIICIYILYIHIYIYTASWMYIQLYALPDTMYWYTYIYIYIYV